MQVVGWPDITAEGGQCRWREAERGLFLIVLPCKAISLRKHYPYSEMEEIMDTRLARISQLSKENPTMVFTSIGHLIDKRLLMQCHAKMDGEKAVGIDGITKEEYGKNLDENLNELIARLKKHAYKPSENTER